MKTVKTEYVKPAMTVFVMATECNILAGSGLGGATLTDRVEEEDEI